MNTKLAFQIAVTHLVTKRKQSLVAMLGVMFGISMFIVMISFMTGVNNLWKMLHGWFASCSCLQSIAGKR
jgi:lipoprotein-releasing system permease protein